MNNLIKFSIITVTYNAKSELKKTINSVQEQNYKYFSHLIKDGYSKDKTNKIDFSKYKNTEFYLSKDKGVYDAMNQAFKLAKNEYIIFLNAGDIFFSKDSLKKLAIDIRNNPNYNIYSGGTIQININEKSIKRIIGIGKLYRYLPLAQLPHPSFVIKKSILSKLKKPFDSELKIASDYKQQLILRKNNLWKTCHLNQIISIMPTGGISTLNKDSIILRDKETFFSLQKYINISYRIYYFETIYFSKLFMIFLR